MFFGGEHTDGIFDLARARSEALESTLVIWMPSSYTISSPNIWSEAEERPVKIDKIGIGPGYMENTLGMSLLPVEVCFTVRLMTPPKTQDHLLRGPASSAHPADVSCSRPEDPRPQAVAATLDHTGPCHKKYDQRWSKVNQMDQIPHFQGCLLIAP